MLRSRTRRCSGERLENSDKQFDNRFDFLLPQAEQKLTAVIVLTKTKKVNIENILEWCGENMEETETPTTFKIVSQIDRDNFGHVDKIKLKALFPDEAILCFHDSKL